MPEEPVVVNPGPTPSLDATAIQTMVEGAVSDALARRAQDFPEEPQGGGRRLEPQVNPLAAAIEPVVGPAMRSLGVASAAAQDAALFYSQADEKESRLRAKFKGQIEEGFNTLIKQGTPFSREAVWAWYKGTHQDEFIKVAITEHDASVKAAQEAETVGPSTRLSDSPTAVNPYGMKDEDLDKALSNIAF